MSLRKKRYAPGSVALRKIRLRWYFCQCSQAGAVAYRVDKCLMCLRISVTLSLLLVMCAAERIQAQQQPNVRTYRPNPADEDWSFLRTAAKNDFWDPVKYISFGPDDRYLTLSGEMRFRPEGFRIRGREGTPPLLDNYLLQRYLFGADLHLSRGLRVFTEVQSGILSGKLQSPRPSDRNSVDLHQAFVEWRHPLSEKRLFGVKAGRQEVTVGSSRLISASAGMNVKRSFDGAVVYYLTNSWRFYGVGAKLVSIQTGIFDDRPDHEQTFWAAAATRQSSLFKQGEFAVFYLGLDRAQIAYAQGGGRDQRHTVGLKWSGSGTRMDLNYDAILQWGAFNGAPIRAWALSTETGYRFVNLPWKPRISLRADIATGDKDAKNPRLQSFNPLFPGNSYAGAVGLFGPTNLTDVTPAVSTLVRRQLVLGFEAPSYWRTSVQDGLYSTDQRLLLPPSIGQGKYVGTNPGIIGVWQATGHLQFQGAISRFLPGRFLEKTFVAHGFGFYSVTALYRF